MNTLLQMVNVAAERLIEFAAAMLWQSSLLILVLFVVDAALRRRVRASVRYALWLIVIVKLMLPATLALPTSIAWWLRPATVAELPGDTSLIVTYAASAPVS